MKLRKNVRLRFRPFDFDSVRPPTLVEVDEDGAILKCGTRTEVADWLKLMGYRYISGTNGVWTQQ